jgi:hypothetical protein
METEQPKRPTVVYAPAPSRHRWNFEIPSTLGHVYVACAHKRLMAVESDEAIYVAGDAEDRFWCPNCRRKRILSA